MSKIGGTYPTIIQGVSEKEPQYRRPGQTGEQVNVLPDPVYGLVRRRGTAFAARHAVSLTPEAKLDMSKMDVFDFTVGGKDYALLYRRFASVEPKERFAFLYCKTDKTFLPIEYEASTWVNTLVAGGVSAVIALGDYVYIAGNTTIPTATTTVLWDDEDNQNRLAAWFRVGKYSTTYKVSLIRADGTRVTKEYTTKSSAYPIVLDTSAIPFFELDGTTPRPDYQKDVNDAVNAYNGEVNAWIKEAAEDIQPENIAQKIADEFLLDSWAVTTTGNGGFLSDDPEFVNIEVDDGGDQTTVFAAGREITDATKVVKYHYHGKIIRVRPSGGGADEAYYLEARREDGVTSGYGAVDWFEVAGVGAQITQLVAQMIVFDGTAYIARDGAGLEALAPTSGEHPDYKPRVAGDGLTAPLPWFIGKPITMLAAFQDRLLVGSQNYVNASKSGDYLNFFRGSILNLDDSDPIEVFAHGSEGDILRASTLYNRNLIIFGDKQQYGIDGSALFTPRSPLIAPISANKDATACKPVSSGNFIFYPQYGDSTSLHQMRVGALNGQQTITDEVSEEVGSWLNGRPLQIAAITAPNYVLYRTEGHAQSVYYYFYLDDKNNGERHVSSWGKLEYSPSLGTVIGVSSFRKEGIIFTAREGYVVADTLSFKGDPDQHGNFDSRVHYADRALIDVEDDDAVVVMGSDHTGFLLGSPMDRYDEFVDQFDTDVSGSLWYGVVSPGFVTPTNPFARDQNGQPILDGRMVLGIVGIDVDNTAGLVGEVTTLSGTVVTTNFEGRILGSSGNVIGTQPRHKGALKLSVGREVRDCTYTLRTKDWLPMQITGLSYSGQVFNNVRRVS